MRTEPRVGCASASPKPGPHLWASQPNYDCRRHGNANRALNQSTPKDLQHVTSAVGDEDRNSECPTPAPFLPAAPSRTCHEHGQCQKTNARPGRQFEQRLEVLRLDDPDRAQGCRRLKDSDACGQANDRRDREKADKRYLSVGKLFDARLFECVRSTRVSAGSNGKSPRRRGSSIHELEIGFLPNDLCCGILGPRLLRGFRETRLSIRITR